MSTLLWCPVCGTRSAKMTGAAGDDAVSVQCCCGLVFLMPSTEVMITRLKELFGRTVSDYLGGEPAHEAVTADG